VQPQVGTQQNELTRRSDAGCERSFSEPPCVTNGRPGSILVVAGLVLREKLIDTEMVNEFPAN
jgi:hypothetical protein